MGILFSNEIKYVPNYTTTEYIKRRPGKNTYKIHKKKVYWRGEVLEGANGMEFTDLGEGYGKDNTYVFYKGFKIHTSEPMYFHTLKNKYATDNVNIYCRGKKIKGVDIKTFESDRYGDAHDKNYKYKDCKRLVHKKRISRK